MATADSAGAPVDAGAIGRSRSYSAYVTVLLGIVFLLAAAGIPSLTRAEALTLDQWAALARAAS